MTMWWQICPPSYGNFTDSCSDSSYFFPTLRVQHLVRPGLGRTTSISKGNFTDSCSTLRVHIWQKIVYRSPHPLKWQFHRFLLCLHIFLSYSKSSSFGRPVLCRSMPQQEAISQIPALLWEFIFGRPSVGRSTPLSNGYLRDSCSDCSYFSPTLRAHI